jgi:hypothetical protein
MACQRKSPSTKDEQGARDHFLFSEGMTMRNLVWAALATGILLAGFGVASASDTVRLGGPSAQAAIQGGTDTELTRGRAGFGGHGAGFHHGSFHHGGFHHGGFHHGGFFARGFFAGGYYRPSYYGYYRPYYYSSYYSPYYYGSYYGAYNSPYYYSSYYCPIAGESVAPPVTTLQGNGYYQASPQYAPPTPSPVNGNGTFQYDGGPRSPIPMPIPDSETNPAKTPRGIIPIDGRLVSLPTQATGGVSVPFTHVPAKTSVPRVTYPAYGE